MLPETPYTVTEFGNQSTIWNGYEPFLSISVPQARAIDPAWSSCNFYQQSDDPLFAPHGIVSVTVPLDPMSMVPLPVPAPPLAQPASNGVPEMPSRTASQSDPVNTQAQVNPQPAASMVSLDPQLGSSLPAANAQLSAPQQSNSPHRLASVVSADPPLHAQSGSGSPSPQAAASSSNSLQLPPVPSQGAGLSSQPEGDPLVPGSSNRTVAASPQSIAYSGALITIGSQVVTVFASGPFVIDGSTLSTNAPAATVSGKTISLGPSGIVIGGSTVLYSSLFPPTAGNPTRAPTQQPPTAHASLTLESLTLTAAHGPSLSSLIVDGSATLTVGGPVATINGHTVSAEPSGIVVNGMSTITLSGPSAATSAAGGIGGIILSMLGPWESPASTTAAVGYSTVAPNQTIEPFRGAASGRGQYERVTWLMVALIVALVEGT